MLDEETTESIDEVARILTQLKREVRQRHDRVAGTEPVMPPGISGLTWPPALEQVHATSRVNPHLPIAWPTWPKGLWPKLVAAMQKVTRRLLRWYINPMVEQQNRFNAATAQALDLLWQEIVHLQLQLTKHNHASETEDE